MANEITSHRFVTIDELKQASRRFSKEAFLLLAQKHNPFRGPQKPTDGDKKKKKKKKGTY